MAMMTVPSLAAMARATTPGRVMMTILRPRGRGAILSRLQVYQITQRRYARESDTAPYTSEAWPPLSFEYTRAEIGTTGPQ